MTTDSSYLLLRPPSLEGSLGHLPPEWSIWTLLAFDQISRASPD